MDIFTERVNAIDGYLTIPMFLKNKFNIERNVRFDYTDHYVTIRAIDKPDYVTKSQDAIDLEVDQLNRIKIPNYILEELGWNIPGFPLLYVDTEEYIVVRNNIHQINSDLKVKIGSEFLGNAKLDDRIYISVTTFHECIILKQTFDESEIVLEKVPENEYILQLTKEILENAEIEADSKVCFERYENEVIIRKI